MAFRLRRSAADLSKDCRGVAATEFVMIVPLMLTMFFGVVEFSSGVAVDRKVDAGGANAFRPYLAVDVGDGYRPQQFLCRKRR